MLLFWEEAFTKIDNYIKQARSGTFINLVLGEDLHVLMIKFTVDSITSAMRIRSIHDFGNFTMIEEQWLPALEK